MNIILFDDHELFAKSLEYAMKKYVTSFTTYVSPENIENILLEERPNIILMDIRLGDYNGLEVAKKVLSQYPDMKIIFLSGYNLTEYHNEAIKMGAKGFINKNVGISEFVEKVNLVASGGTIFPEHDKNIEPLSKREKEVLQLAAEGLKQQEIAEKLFISRRTVNNHIQTINEKFFVTSTIAAIVRGIELGIISLNPQKSASSDMESTEDSANE